MKNTFITSALVAVLGFALASAPVTSKAQTTPTQTTAATSTGSTTPSKPAKKKSEYTAFSGTLKSLDATSAVVTTKKGDVTLAVDASTGFHVNKKKAAATDFAAGDAVTGSYATNADGSFTAHNINKKK
jgi:hypothetical protein